MLKLDPDRAHGLDDVIEHMHAVGCRCESWLPSWSDVSRVREYVGVATWAKLRQQTGNDYDLAHHVLYHLDEVERTRRTIAPYVAIACSPHDVPAGKPCAHVNGDMFLSITGQDLVLGRDLDLPTVPVVCTWRLLAQHDRLAAMELFERRAPVPVSEGRAYRVVLPLSCELEGDVAVVRAQHRGPHAFTGERLYVSQATNWTIHDVRIAGKSVLAPHHDLPGLLFGSMSGPHLPLPIVEQDQWIEVEARRVHGDAPRFYASLVGIRESA